MRLLLICFLLFLFSCEEKRGRYKKIDKNQILIHSRKVLISPRYHNISDESNRLNHVRFTYYGFKAELLEDYIICPSKKKNCDNLSIDRIVEITIEVYRENSFQPLITYYSLGLFPTMETKWFRSNTVVKDSEGNVLKRFSIVDGIDKYYHLIFTPLYWIDEDSESNIYQEMVRLLIDHSVKRAYDEKLI